MNSVNAASVDVGKGLAFNKPKRKADLYEFGKKSGNTLPPLDSYKKIEAGSMKSCDGNVIQLADNSPYP